MGMFDEIREEHQRTKNTPKPTFEEVNRAKWAELGLAELAEEYAVFAQREHLPMWNVRHRDGAGTTPAWAVHGRDGEYDFSFGVLADGAVLPIERVTPFGEPIEYGFNMWHGPHYTAGTVKDAFLSTARWELARRDGTE